MTLKIMVILSLINLFLLGAVQTSIFDASVVMKQFEIKQKRLNDQLIVEDMYPYLYDDMRIEQAMLFPKKDQEKPYEITLETVEETWERFRNERDQYENGLYKRFFENDLPLPVGEHLYLRVEGLAEHQQAVVRVYSPYSYHEAIVVGTYEEIIKIENAPSPITLIEVSATNYLESAQATYLSERILLIQSKLDGHLVSSAIVNVSQGENKIIAR